MLDVKTWAPLLFLLSSSELVLQIICPLLVSHCYLLCLLLCLSGFSHLLEVVLLFCLHQSMTVKVSPYLQVIQKRTERQRT